MRLISLNRKLADKFVDENQTIGAQTLFAEIFLVCFDTHEDNAKQELSDLIGSEDLKERKLPGPPLSETMHSEFDDLYLDAQEDGNQDLSEKYFKMARILAAIELNKNAVSSTDFSEAAYEALMSTDDPQKYAGEMLQAIEEAKGYLAERQRT